MKGDDETKPDACPWEEYAKTARLRGITVEAEALRDHSHTVLPSAELATIYEFLQVQSAQLYVSQNPAVGELRLMRGPT